MADIEIRNVYKIFGHDAKKALTMVEDGLDKADILSGPAAPWASTMSA